MCGLVVFVDRELLRPDREQICGVLRDSMAHRGPDAAGLWSSDDFPITLGHRRLSILDLSPSGHQPMQSRSGRFCMVFNGEIYNFAEIRIELEKRGSHFRGTSDTEVLLAAFDEYGIQKTLSFTNGMFAIAVWDRQERRLVIARDRLGKKPLFYGWHKKGFVAGSELRVMFGIPAQQWELDRDTTALFFRQNYYPPPHTPLRGVYKLLPGCSLVLEENELLQMPRNFSAFDKEDDREHDSGDLCPTRYWDLRTAWKDGESMRSSPKSDQDWMKEARACLSSAVARRMVSDVPLGALLSGGIDSSLICALMQSQSSSAIQTFTVRFEEAEADEGEYAAEVARLLGTAHNELYVRYTDAFDLIPRLPTLYDEPLGDASQIPTFLVSQFARTKVTVALSGDAGDELFWGYQRYFLAERLQSAIENYPASFRKVFQSLLQHCPTRITERLFRFLYLFLPRNLHISRPAAKLGRLAELLEKSLQGDFYREFVTHWKNPSELLPKALESYSLFDRGWAWNEKPSELIAYASLLDMLTYLPGDIFYKVDQASMAASLEARSPFCDAEVIQLAFQMPARMKVRNGKGKWILRQLLREYFPEDLFERPKQGFMIPMAEWLRGPLREWAEDLLIFLDGHDGILLSAAPIRKKWSEHIEGKGSWEYPLWDVFQFLAWYREWKTKLVH